MTELFSNVTNGMKRLCSTSRYGCRNNKIEQRSLATQCLLKHTHCNTRIIITEVVSLHILRLAPTRTFLAQRCNTYTFVLVHKYNLKTISLTLRIPLFLQIASLLLPNYYCVSLLFFLMQNVGAHYAN